MNKKGFTLVELLIVVAIIGILASVVVITLIGQTGKATDSALKTNLRSLASITSDAVSRNPNFDFTKFCDVEDTNTDQAAYGVRGIMNSVFESAALDPENGISKTVNNDTNGNVSLYYVAIHTAGDDEGEQATENDLSSTRIDYGCASHRTGWVAWGKLQEDVDGDVSSDPDYYCIDSFGSNGTRQLKEAPTDYKNIKTSSSNPRLNCALIEAAN